ncbi:hypothetical protein [Actinomadura sp. WMMA1423]|uniref:hypothetical protein n=1 Tax=Actinomadura sp. WMMA1423 TaxID=2591108 RepID=UPI001146A880|nr:hypothetical protein [Actinomadura sp. WMMA1423]
MVCAPGYREGVREARTHGIPHDALIMAGGVHRLRGLLGFNVLVVEGFSQRHDAIETWALLLQRAERSRASSAGNLVLPFWPPPHTHLYRADVDDGAVYALTRLLEPFATGTPPMVPLNVAATVAADLLERHTVRTAQPGGGDGEPRPGAAARPS